MFYVLSLRGNEELTIDFLLYHQQLELPTNWCSWTTTGNIRKRERKKILREGGRKDGCMRCCVVLRAAAWCCVVLRGAGKRAPRLWMFSVFIKRKDEHMVLHDVTVWELPVILPLLHVEVTPLRVIWSSKGETDVLQGRLIVELMLLAYCLLRRDWWGRMAGGYFPDKSSSRMRLDARLRKHAVASPNVLYFSIGASKPLCNITHVQFSKLQLLKSTFARYVLTPQQLQSSSCTHAL